MAENKNVNMKPIHNPELDAAIQALKSGSTPEKQQALLNALKSARLLSPCDFDVNVKPDKNGEIKNVHPNQIKFYLLNTNDGKTLFPVFTDIPRTRKINLGDKIDPKYVVRQVKEFDPLLTMPDSKAVGLVVNPGSDNIVIPAQLVGVIAGRPIQTAGKKVNPAPAPLNITYGEPAVYPTRMVNAIYDRAEQMEEIRHVWLKGKFIGRDMHFFVVVDSTKQEESVLNAIREVAVPLSKGVEVEVVFLNDEIQNKIIKDSVALYDDILEL